MIAVISFPKREAPFSDAFTRTPSRKTSLMDAGKPASTFFPNLHDVDDLGPPLVSGLPLADGISTAHDEALAELLQQPKQPPHKAPPVHSSHLGDLRNPYDGSILGTLDISAHPEAHFMSDAQTENEELWGRLSRVLDLQAHIAKLHVNMEGVGNAQSGAGGGGGDFSSPISNNGRMPLASRGRGSSGMLSEAVEDEDADVTAEADAEEVKNKQREAEFTRLGDQFTARKAGTDEIMNQACVSIINIVYETNGCHIA